MIIRTHSESLKKDLISLAAADLRQVRFYDLRHTFASLLIQQEANPKYIQQQLGHGSISITLDIYSPLFQGDHRHHVHQLDDPQENREITPIPQPRRNRWKRRLKCFAELVNASEQTPSGGVTERPNVPVLKTDSDPSEVKKPA